MITQIPEPAIDYLCIGAWKWIDDMFECCDTIYPPAYKLRRLDRLFASNINHIRNKSIILDSIGMFVFDK